MKQDLYDYIVAYIVENQNKFYRLAYSYVRNREDVLDVVQNTVCKALENYGGIRNEGAISTWFYRILVNESLLFIKERKRMTLGETDQEEAHYEEKGFEIQDDLYDSINRLDGDTQTIIKLRFFEELSLKEIVPRSASAEGEYSGGRCMRTLQDAKKTYDETAIPSELSERIQMEIKKADRKRKKILFFRRVRGGTAAAAAAVVLFTTALNTSTSFAETAGNLPVIGAVARVLTFRSYQTEEDALKISVEIPSVEMISEDFKGLEQSVNEEILRLCEQYAEEAKTTVAEYRKAFLETGGTEEEWAAHNIEIRVWYEVKSQTDQYLSLAIIGTQNWSSAYNQTKYYNFDLEKGTLVTLEDILGANYKEIADAEIRRQMEERTADGAVYFDSFEGIDADTAFYMNEAGNPVIVFEKYEIAPGSEGQQEFEIKKG